LSVLALTATFPVQESVLVSTGTVLGQGKDKVKNFTGVGAESVSADS